MSTATVRAGQKPAATPQPQIFPSAQSSFWVPATVSAAGATTGQAFISLLASTTASALPSTRVLGWWLQPGHLDEGISLEPPHRLILTASHWGWGACLQTKIVQGRWSLKELRHSINRLELRANWLALLHFSNSIRYTHILVQMDNVSAKAFTNHQGGTRSKGMMKDPPAIYQG